MKWQKFKNLDFIVSQKDNSKTCVILFHGYGADAKDLSSLAQVYDVGEEVDWFFPQGVIEVPFGPMMSGRAWFELRVSDFEQVSRGEVKDRPLDPRDEKTMGLVSEWLNQLGKVYENVFIGGFSQGAILTSHSLYRLQFKPAGLLLFSGFLISPSSFPTLPEDLKISFFQSHGKQDQVLNIGGARKLYDFLEKMGLSGNWFEFSGGHEIPMNTIAESQKFLKKSLNR